MGAMLQQVGRLDEAWILGLAARRVPRWLDRTFRWGTHLGGATATLLIGVALVLFPATRAAGLSALVANVISHGVAQILKRRFVRPRPHLVLDALAPLVPIPDEFSFPSGHSCAAMAVASPILVYEPLIGIGAIALALLVGTSRVYLRVHFVTDVIMGFLLGLLGTAFAVMTIG